jgi:hypothetical protein
VVFIAVESACIGFLAGDRKTMGSLPEEEPYSPSAVTLPKTMVMERVMGAFRLNAPMTRSMTIVLGKVTALGE